MKRTGDHDVPPLDLRRLAHRAWLDLKQARKDNDPNRMLRAERRMNALLDELSARPVSIARRHQETART